MTGPYGDASSLCALHACTWPFLDTAAAEQLTGAPASAPGNDFEARVQAMRQQMNESTSAMDQQFAAVNKHINQAVNALSDAINDAVDAVADAFTDTFQQPLQLPPFPDTMGGYASADAHSAAPCAPHLPLPFYQHRTAPALPPVTPALSHCPSPPAAHHVRHVPHLPTHYIRRLRPWPPEPALSPLTPATLFRAQPRERDGRLYSAAVLPASRPVQSSARTGESCQTSTTPRPRVPRVTHTDPAFLAPPHTPGPGGSTSSATAISTGGEGGLSSSSITVNGQTTTTTTGGATDNGLGIPTTTQSVAVAPLTCRDPVEARDIFARLAAAAQTQGGGGGGAGGGGVGGGGGAAPGGP